MKRSLLSLASCIVLAVGMASPAFVCAQESSIVVCQKKRNPQKIKLRPDACKPKENLILNLTQALTIIESYLGVVCEGDRARTVFAGKSDALACEQFQGNESGCASAFASGDLGEGSVSCFFDNDEECAPCGPSQETGGFCTNTCASE